MSFRQDRLTFFGVLVAVVIAVLGYLQLGSLYPVEGRAQTLQHNPDLRGDEAEKAQEQEVDNASGGAARQEEDAVP